jgi:acetyltransferase-like isoleucine patch superfamily enzyme
MPRLYPNAIVGDDTIVEDDVNVGWRYHPDCGLARIGKNGILRKGTIVYGDVDIGDYFQSGHYVVIRAKVRMGDYCTVLNHSALEGIIRFGNGVRIMSHVYVCSRTWFGDHVFVGPGVIFLNERFPGRTEKLGTPRGAFVEDDVTIGGGCTILPGVKIGSRSFIAAGTVVHKDIPPRSLAKGVPCTIESLPAHLDRPNDRQLTLQPIDLWHPRGQNPSDTEWPPDWPSKFDEI